MSSKDIPERQLTLIGAYLSGNTTEAEVAELESWVSASAKNREHFVAAKRAWTISSLTDQVEVAGLEKSWKAVASQTTQPAKTVVLKPSTKSTSAFNWRLAAGIALLLGVGLWAMLTLGSPKELQLQADTGIVSSDLPDGSHVSLNQGTMLTYRFDRSNQERQVHLQGDAFFEVDRDEERPFVVKAGEITVEVLGTSFYVDAKSEVDTVRVIVKSGSVSVGVGAEEVVLKAEEVGLFDRSSQQLSKAENVDLNYLAWQSEVLRFENQTLASIVEALNNHFQTQIKLDNEVIAACRMTATFTNKSLETIVEIIEKTLKLEAKVVDGEYVFTGNKCK